MYKHTHTRAAHTRASRRGHDLCERWYIMILRAMRLYARPCGFLLYDVKNILLSFSYTSSAEPESPPPQTFCTAVLFRRRYIIIFYYFFVNIRSANPVVRTSTESRLEILRLGPIYISSFWRKKKQKLKLN